MDDLNVRQLRREDLEDIVDYFLNGDDAFLSGMGVDRLKMPPRDHWLKILEEEFSRPDESKQLFYLIWLLNGVAVGHSNINKIIFGEEAYMHLHSWNRVNRGKGLGYHFVRICIPYYFDIFKLKKLYCEPYALNPAPNSILKKTGFDFIKTHETIPGWICFRQSVNTWCLDAEKFKLLYRSRRV
jgi:RimJ/RimL family protein N-acetyltransferase